MQRALKAAKARRHLRENVSIVAASVFISIILARSDVFTRLITGTEGIAFVATFFAGFFFTSVFTTAPATVALAEIAQAHPLVPVALIGGFGALMGDIILFSFLKNEIGNDLATLFDEA